MTTVAVGKDRPTDNGAVVHLHTVRGDVSRKHVKVNMRITIKGNALGVAAIQRPEQTPPASVEFEFRRARTTQS